MLTSYGPGTAQLVADCLMKREGLLTKQWSYDYGVVWRGMEMLYRLTGDKRYHDYIYRAVSEMVGLFGTPKGYSYSAYNLDYLNNGRQLLYLAKTSDDFRFRTAADLLREQLDDQMRTSDRGFWHKKIYPYQMWLDGQHMAIPFYLGYERDYGTDPAAKEDAALQLVLAWKHTLDPDTGLPCHGWDEKRTQIWADPKTGRSAHAWGRAVGWYMVALVDSLELMEEDNRYYGDVLSIFRELSCTLLANREEGVWLQVLDQRGRPGNYLESSGSCLICYALLKGVRLGLLPSEYGTEATESFESIQTHFVGRMKNGEWFIAKCCQGAGLGGNSGRDGSFDYYISENVVSHDLKATGAYIQAACEDQLMREGRQSYA